MKRTLVLAAVAMLSACSSVNFAGSARYSIEPIPTDAGFVCCKVLVENGKEYTSLKAHIERKADGGYVVDLDERNVRAFDGQGKAADAIEAVINGALIP